MASLAYKHNSYYAIFSINGKKKWIKIGRVDKKEARKLLKQMELEHIRGKLEINETKEILFYDYIDQYMSYCKTNKASSTYAREMQAIKSLKSFFGNICLPKIDNKSIEDYKSQRKSKGLSTSSINRELTVLSVMLKKAVQWNYLNRIPVISILALPKRPPRYLSLDEMNTLLDCSTEWLRPILIILRNTGMRIGEVLQLRFKDIDLVNNLILVRSQKTKNYRVIPINCELREILEWLHKYYVHPNTMQISIRHANQRSYIICHPDGTKVKCIKNSFNKACKRAGIESTIHMIRHTFASHLVMNQVDLISIKELLGHSSISTTMIYSHVSRDYKDKTVARLPWVKIHT